MPQFVLPAARWLTPSRPPSVLLVEKACAGERRLIGAGCFSIEPASWFVPISHLAEYGTRHSFRSGMLHEDDQALAVAEAVAVFLARPGSRGRLHALSLRNVRAACPLLQALQSQSVTRTRWIERSRFLRPVLGVDPGVDPESSLKRSARKDLARRRRRLEELATFQVRVRLNPGCDAQTAESHLALEHDGWKGHVGSAMLCTPAEAGFFRELAARHRDLGDQCGLVFSELLADGEVIASTSNFLLGDSLSAFKTGWRASHAAYSPGRLNEVELCRRLPELMPQVRTFDSLSKPDSYLAELLPDREVICSGVLAMGRMGEAAMRAARLVRPIAYWRDRDD